MAPELKFFLIKFGALILLSPAVGFALLKYADYFEKVWKTGNRRKKWLLMSILYFCLSVIGGWLR